MNDELYNLYLKCFPDYSCSREWFDILLKPDQAVVFAEHENNQLIAFSMIWGNSISLLCVDPAHQNKRIGSRLLKKSEEHISQNDAEKIILGCGPNYLLQGVPTTNTKTVLFFEKRGYKAGWTSVNMALALDGFSCEKINIPALPSDILFRFADDMDKDALLAAVDDAQPNWRGVFETCVDPVLLAVESKTNKLIGFEVLSFNGGRFIKNAGCIGCVGIIPSARNKGIGRRMVVEGIEWLKSQGSSCIELRYVALVDWYKTLGFEITGSQWMGEKELKQKIL